MDFDEVRNRSFVSVELFKRGYTVNECCHGVWVSGISGMMSFEEALAFLESTEINEQQTVDLAQ